LGPDGRDIGYWMAHRTTVGTQIAVLAAAGWLGGNDHLRDTGLLLGQSQALSAGLTQLLKLSIGRDRPDGSNDRSFPSGHATAAWTTAVVLQDRYGAWLGFPAHLAALYVGLSRMQDTKHHPSDVIAGFAVAQWTSRAVLRSADPRRSGSVTWLRPAWRRGPAFDLVALRF
jgi:membrane-associated phospholipid phosphatase